MNGKTDDRRPFSQHTKKPISAAREGRRPRLGHYASPRLSEEQWKAVGKELLLSSRELPIVRAILSGHKEASIAGMLDISPYTVHSHVNRLYKKLGVHSRCDLAVHVMNTCLSLGARSDPPRGVPDKVATASRRRRGAAPRKP